MPRPHRAARSMAARIAERRQQPLPQQARTHRREGEVDALEQRRPPHPGPERLHQLEVAARHLVEPEVGIVAAHDRAAPGAASRPAGARSDSGAAHRRRRRPAASAGSSPRPSSDATPNRRANSSRARSGSNSHGSREVMSGGSGAGGLRLTGRGYHQLGGVEPGQRLAQRAARRPSPARIRRC